MTDSPAPSPPWRLRASIRRLILTLLVVGQTVLASWFLLQVLPYHGGNLVEWLIVGVLPCFICGLHSGSGLRCTGFCSGLRVVIGSLCLNAIRQRSWRQRSCRKQRLSCRSTTNLWPGP